MIISQTPFRISFFGGGTDYPVWFNRYEGEVIGTTINKYCYVNCKTLLNFFDYNYKIVYSINEEEKFIKNIKHPVVRESLKFFEIMDRLEIHYDSDLPGRSGLGSSSAFTVGLINCLMAHQGKYSTKNFLAKSAINIEQNYIKENVGNQDQIHSAYGGFNHIKFFKNRFAIKKVIISKEKLDYLKSHLLLVYSGITRKSSDIAKYQIKATLTKEKDLFEMKSMVKESLKILSGNIKNYDEFGKLLDESWKLKRNLTDKISIKLVEEAYETALSAGAIGGKLLGAGGGGFILLYAKPKHHKNIILKLSKFPEAPFDFENEGSKIIFYNN